MGPTITSADEIYVALLRGINVGGKNKLSMGDLIAIFDEAGCNHVRSYIQSGNIVFRATKACASRVPRVIPKVISDRLGLRVPIVMRSAVELRNIVRGNTFLRAGVDPNSLHVMFLAD
jgi:uncharacterized protein (DUF1697 family)